MPSVGVPSGPDPLFEVLATGPLALLQDLGRPGHAHLGVTASGAADRGAAAAANRLVGNLSTAALIESTFGGLRVRARRTALLAVTGAPTTVTVTRAACPPVALEPSTSITRPAHPLVAPEPSTSITRPARPPVAPDPSRSLTREPAPDTTRPPAPFLTPTGYSFTVFAGDTVDVAAPTAGLRTYLAVRGGFDAEPVLGSRSTDLLSGLGPAPLRAGDLLPVASDAAAWPAADVIPASLPDPDPVVLTVHPGPRDDWFGPAGLNTLTATTWTTTPESNRIGIRLHAATRLDRRSEFEAAELPSEGLVLGAVQIPPSGHPLIFLRDHPTTGGYPVIGVLTPGAIDLAAQLRPGVPLRFRLASGSEPTK